MLKPLLLLAVTANLFFIATVAARKVCKTESSASSSSYSSENHASSSSSATVITSDCDDDRISCGGDPNAQPGCDKLCRRRCVDQETSKCSCPAKNSCECKPGYVFDAVTYKCVSPKNCTKTKLCPKPNEVFDVCPAPCPPRRCDVDERVIRCAAPPKPGDPDCKPGCRCADDYKRNDKGVCIRKEECPQYCGVNEVFDKCPAPCPPQRCDVDERTIDCIAPPKPGDPECEPGCRCLDNYKRNDKGVCIRKEECPQYCPGPNEVFDDCPAPCPPQRCDVDITVILCAVAPEPGSPECKPGCRCIDDYVRNSSGICIPRDQCEPQCTENEEYNKCPDKICDAKTCAELGFGLNCTLTDDDPCPGKPGCVCKFGYVRNDQGVCIPKEKCPTCKGDPNAQPGCGTYCNQQCSSIGKEPQPCILLCYLNACDCKEGFYYDNNTGKCVPPNECTPTCGKDEVYSDCVNGGCEPRNCTQLGFPVPCVRPKKCRQGCVCKENYLRNNKGVCVPRSKCPPYCSPQKHEVYSECINGGCQAKNCSQLGKPIPCIKIDPKYCIKGCLCEERYLRASNGTCIPEDQCNPCKRPNEYFDRCPSVCPPQTCESIGKVYSCPAIIDDPSRCKPACRCKKGYYRNLNGECISKAQCLQCNGPHEYFSCGGACDNVCKTIKKQNQTHCPIINIKCNERCYCEKDHARAKNNTCIPISQCNEPQCPLNEVYVQCPVGLCRALTCNQLGYPVNCTQPDPCPKKPACVCVEGYVRNSSNVCVPVDQCPSCGGDKNATSGCGFCGQYCSDIGKGPVACPLICKINGCQCKKGYSYDQNTKKCVLSKDCTPTCGVNEQYVNCPDALCRPQNCTQVGFPIPCPATTPDSGCPGKPGCVCKDNYAKNYKGVCIPIQECPSCRGDLNATSGCGFCGHRCSDIGKGPVPCPKICEVNGCQCRKGYFHDKNKMQCVLPVDCTPQCGLNEEYSTCPLLLCRPENCTQAGFPIACPRVTQDFKCPEKPRCVCKPEYARNDKGICIPINECSECHGDPNATPGCGYCGQRCSDIGKGPVVCPAICEINGCRCKDGYYYDKIVGKCVLPKQCSPECGLNEEYMKCPAELCRPENCSQLGYQILCSLPDPDKECPVKPRCVCSPGYARNEKGVCVPLDECPSCGGDFNATAGCGYCGHRCADIGKKRVICPRIACKLNDCQCKAGYYYDAKLGHCILATDCPNPCGKNEEVSNCVNGGCDKRNCSQLGQPTICINPFVCNVGCVCKQGYLRDPDGICVPINDCPACGGDPNAKAGCGNHCNRRCSDIGRPPRPCPLFCKVDGCDCRDGHYFDENTGKCVKPENCSCSKENEVFDLCPLSCPPQTCESLDRAYICPIETGEEEPCRPGCRCKDGYFRNIKGLCNTEAQCRQCNGPHEYYACSVACDNVCATLSEQNQTHCPIINVKCNEMCYCEEGHARAKNKTCIPISKCNEPQCDINEQYDECPTDRCRPENCCQLGYPLDCESVVTPDTGCEVEPKCTCKDGYARNSKGVCIPVDECPTCRGDPNAKPGCGFCFTKQCPHHGDGVVCPAICEANGCVCKDFHYYDRIQKKCVLIEDCTPICPKNEVPNDCVNGGCDKRNCSQLNQPDICINVIKCYKGCVCKKGYLRNDEGVCVPISKCSPKCGDNEMYHDCIEGLCDAKTCGELGFPVPCPDLTPEQCTKGCLCIPDYVRAENGTCIKKINCPSCGGDTNAQYGCGVNCGKHCRDIGKKDPVCLDICNFNACDCKPGYYFDDNTGKCVRRKKCTPQCPKNEIYNTCVQGDCKPKNCSQLGFPVSCPRIDPAFCIGGCLCVEGYARAINGTCIPARECPSCGGDKNAQAGCGINCGKRCTDIGKEVSCIDLCLENACDCKDGYYLHQNTGKCVRPNKCPPSCPDNEVYNSCVEGYCQPKKCSQLGFPIDCPKKGSYRCTGGCLCKDGYVRANNRTCIPIKQCPSCGGDSNAVSGCGVNCNQRCSDLAYEDEVDACIEICYNNSCDCKPGFYFDEYTKLCVLPENCTGVCDRPHEVFEKCPPTCPPQECTSINKKYHCPKQPVSGTDCKPGCRCEKNYFRNPIGECISRKDCLKCTGPHEYFSCDVPCDTECATLDTRSKCNCPIKNKKCTERCYCEDGYARDTNNTCIPIKNCPNPCNEVTTTTTPAPPALNKTELMAKFRKANIALTGQFVYEMAKSNPGKSFVLSTLSVLIAILQLFIYSVGVVRQQLSRVIGLDSNDEAKVVARAIIEDYGGQQNITFEMAVKLYFNDKYPLSDIFLAGSRDDFKAEAESLDFGKNVESANTINDWVANRTHNEIKDLVPAQALSSSTRLVLVNALYFLGSFVKPFDVNKTKDGDFYVSPDKTIHIPFMHQTATFGYCNSGPLNSQILKMDYAGGNFSLIVVLPNVRFGLEDVLDKMRDADVVQKMLECLRPVRVNVSMPRYDIASDLDVADLFKKVNVEEMFNPESDGFKGILKNKNEKLYVSAALQKAMIRSDEKGTTAAAATAIIVGTTSAAYPPPEIPVFDANHPHVYTIYNTGDPAFAGVFCG